MYSRQLTICRSWKNLYDDLRTSASLRDDSNIKEFIAEPTPRSALQNFLSPFCGRSSESKATFETKTAAINLTPSPKGDYDVEQLKSDTQWLSVFAKIDELSALRVVILEWQERPSSRILACSSNDATGHVADSNGFTSISNLILSTRPQGGNANPSRRSEVLQRFESTSRRRLRLLQKFLLERLSILLVAELLASYVLYEDIARQKLNESWRPTSMTANNPTWLKEAGDRIIGVLVADARPGKGRYTLDAYLTHFERRFERLAAGQHLPSDDLPSEGVDQMFQIYSVLEMVIIMRLIIILVASSRVVVKDSEVLAWFTLNEKFDHFHEFVMVSRSTLAPTRNYQ